MKKIAAILLILLLFFNWYGYRIVISILNKNAVSILETRIDQSDYDESQLVEIRVSLNLPYQDRFTDFERHYGEIEIDGLAYTYVKKKIEGNVVIFKCIPNHIKQQIKSLDEGLTKANSGQDNGQADKSPSSPAPNVKKVATDYDDQTMVGIATTLSSAMEKNYSNYSNSLATVILSIPHQPPRQLADLS
ncbi:MAG: hypothetical protein H7Y42_18870 [Chitinophagaceae bacterium]|nr:hypothetical protein [Chitinophagaceae bacterium]